MSSSPILKKRILSKTNETMRGNIYRSVLQLMWPEADEGLCSLKDMTVHDLEVYFATHAEDLFSVLIEYLLVAVDEEVEKTPPAMTTVDGGDAGTQKGSMSIEIRFPMQR